MIIVILIVLGVCVGCIVAESVILYWLFKCLELKKLELYRLNRTSQLLQRWIKRKAEGACIAELLRSRDEKVIAIYGMGILGQLLYSELRNTSISIAFCVDKNRDQLFTDYPITGVTSEWAEVDLMIVTPIDSHSSILDIIRGKGDYKCCYLEDLVYEL